MNEHRSDWLDARADADLDPEPEPWARANDLAMEFSMQDVPPIRERIRTWLVATGREADEALITEIECTVEEMDRR